MHWPTHGQWWSNFWTQLLQIEQWEARGGRYSKQVSQNFTFTVWPLTLMSFIRGIFRLEFLELTHSIDGEVFSIASSESGGCEFLGIIPGSPPDVKNRKEKSCTNHWHFSFFLFFLELQLLDQSPYIPIKEFQFTLVVLLSLDSYFIFLIDDSSTPICLN